MEILKNFLLVGFGGFFGAMLRYLIILFTNRTDTKFPLATLIVNVIGCFLIGFLSNAFSEFGVISTDTKLFMITGLLGGFTTFSSFSNETFGLISGGNVFLGTMNVALNVVVGLFAVEIGMVFSNLVFSA